MSKSTEDQGATPPPEQHDRLAGLKQQISSSTRAVRGETKAGYDTLLFLNTRYESFPVGVQHEPLLSPSAKTVYNNLWIWAKTKQSSALSTSLFPEYEWIMRAAGISRGSVASSIAQLRLMRYITLHQKVRNENHQFVGNDYILNDEPMTISDSMEIDTDYVQFVSNCATKHRHKRVQSLAQAALNALNAYIDKRDDPYRTQSHIEKVEARQQAAMIIQQRLFPDEELPQDSPKPTEYFGIPIADYEAAMSRVHKMNAEDETTQVHNVNAGNSSQVHNMNAAPKSTRVHKVNAAQTASEHRVHNMNPDMNAEVNSSSSRTIYNKPTTTEPTEFTEPKKSPQTGGLSETLVFPPFKYPSDKNLCSLTLAKLPQEYQQPMLDELAGRLEDTTLEPVRNTVGYLQKMVNRFLNDDFTFTSYSSIQAAKRSPQQATKKPARDIELDIRNLQSEIAHLNRLIEFNQSQGNQGSADGFIEERNEKQQELDHLKADYQATG